MKIFIIPSIKVYREYQVIGKILFKVKSLSYSGVSKYYQQNFSHCNGKRIINGSQLWNQTEKTLVRSRFINFMKLTKFIEKRMIYLQFFSLI